MRVVFVNLSAVKRAIVVFFDCVIETTELGAARTTKTKSRGPLGALTDRPL